MKKLMLLFSLFILAGAGCGSGEKSDIVLPDIASFKSSPSDTFLVADKDFSKISRGFPFRGSDSACPHEGGHIHFTSKGAPYTVDILAPASGYITRVDPCFPLVDSDRYGVSIAFAESGDTKMWFGMGMEPHSGFLCSGGKEGVDNGFYRQFILVEEGDFVEKGDIIARMYKKEDGTDGAHIHFHINKEGDPGFFCPNIFSPSITKTFGEHFGSETCNGNPFPSTFCFQPAPGQNAVGL